MKHSIGGRTKNIDQMVKYVINNNIPGDMIDIGVYEGYSSKLLIENLIRCKSTDRKIYLYDTFEGMPLPTEEDGEKIIKIHKQETNNSLVNSSKWARGTLEGVQKHIQKLKYPKEKIHYVKGMVEDTLPNHKHKQIAYLRLDTDFYSSTKVELKYLYPYISPGGVIIVDDYDSKFIGCTRAVHEYFDENNINRNIITKINSNSCGMYFFKPK